jgi:DNA-binding CsgD family transcriptional regulator
VLEAVNGDTGGIRDIARLLHLSEATVCTHLRRLFEKTGVRRQVDLVKLIADLSSPYQTS